MKSTLELLGRAFSGLPSHDKLMGFALLILLVFAFFAELHPAVGFLGLLAICGGILWLTASTLGHLDQVEHATQAERKTFSAFISAPMASAESPSHRREVNSAISAVKKALVDAGLRKQIYYAGTDRPTTEEYDLPSRALEYNLDVLSQSERYVAVIETEKSSSTFLEVGAALKLGLPSVWFIKKDLNLPFLISDPENLSNDGNLPKVWVYRYDNLSEVAQKIRQYGCDVFR